MRTGIVVLALLTAAALGASFGQAQEFSTDLLQGVKTEHASYPIGETVDIVYALQNKTDSPITYKFRSAKQFDFTVSQAGKDIFTYSRGMMYAQRLTTLTLQPGETKIYRAQWKQVDDSGKAVGPGVYTIRAQLCPTGAKPPSVTTRVQVGGTSAAVTSITISQAIGSYDSLSGRSVQIKGTYRGFQPNANDANVKDGPPVSRSDWAICDSTGCMYVAGTSGGLNPTDDLGRGVTVSGKLQKTQKGQVYLIAENVTAEPR